MARPFQKLKNDLIYYSARILMYFIVRFPYAAISRLGGWFGILVFSLARNERLKTIGSLRIAFSGSLKDDEIRKIAFNVWRNVGRNLFEVIHWTGWPSERITSQVVRIEGLNHVDKAIDRGKGFFIITAHLGNWELLGGVLASKYPLAGVAQKLYDPRFDKLINDFRQGKMGGVSMMKRGFALRGILEMLNKNYGVVSLCDQDTGRDGVFVPFFGKLAWTQSGVARIAQKTGAALIPAFAVRGSDGQFEVHLEKEIEVPRSGNKEKDILETVQRYTEVIETYVRKYPDQWMWMHQRWKTRPDGEKIPGGI